MVSVLNKILAYKQEEVRALKRSGIPKTKGRMTFQARDFKGAISSPRGINLIAEIKFASPSAGEIRDRQDPVGIGRLYEGAGAAAVSLLTDRRFFCGDIEDISRLKKGLSLPILRKDFILDEIQVWESLQYGADAVLLIARILSQTRLKRLLDLCKKIGLSALTEVHDGHDLEKALNCEAEIIGINNRDLDTLVVDLHTTLRLAPRVPKGPVVVSESGIRSNEDIRLLSYSGVRAVLVGTELMRSREIRKKAEELAKWEESDGESQDLRHNQY